MKLLKQYYPYVAIAAAALLAYCNSFTCSFHFDDLGVITEGFFIKYPSYLIDVEYWINPVYRVISLLSFAFDYQLWRLNVVGYHITSLICHGIVSLLVFRFAATVFARTTRAERRDILLWSTFAAVLFAVHPIQTQAVTYIVQRMSVLAALFYILAILVYVRARVSFDAMKFLNSSLWFGLFVIITYLAVFSKQNTLTLPLALLVLEVFLFTSSLPSRRLIIPLLVVSVVTGLLVVYTSGGLPNWDPSITRSQYLIAQARAVLHYIQVVIVPVNQTLDPTVYFNETPWHPLELSGIALVLSLVVVAVACHKKHAPISFGIWWFFATLMVESSFFPISDPIVEHRMYLPMAGLSISLAYVVFLVLRHTTARVRIATLLCLVVVLIAVSIRRNMDWKTDVSLWRAEMQQNPESNRVLNNLGYTYFEAGQIDSAYKYISKSQEFDPGTCFGLNGMGEVLMKKGDTTRALFYFKTAARRCNFFYSYNNLAYHYYKTHDLEQAQSYISKSFEVVEYFKTTYIQYLIFKKMNKPAEAQHFLQKARLMNPDYDYATMYPESSN